MSWFDIIKEDEFEPQGGEFPGTSSEAIAEELSNDNLEITFDEKKSNFFIIVSHSEFGEIFRQMNIENLQNLTRRIKQANKFIKFINKILKVFGNRIKEKEIYSDNGVSFYLIPYGGRDITKLTVVFWRGDSDLGFGFDDGPWDYATDRQSFDNMWLRFGTRYTNHLKLMAENKKTKKWLSDNDKDLKDNPNWDGT